MVVLSSNSAICSMNEINPKNNSQAQEKVETVNLEPIYDKLPEIDLPYDYKILIKVNSKIASLIEHYLGKRFLLYLNPPLVPKFLIKDKSMVHLSNVESPLTKDNENESF